MANSLEKLLDIVSKLASIQQMTNTQQNSNIQSPIIVEDSNISASNENQQTNPKTIYITKEDIESMFPSLKGKLDPVKILSSFTDKSTLSKFLSGLGIISIKPMEENKSSSEPEQPKSKDNQ
jgi:hypothetical protein